MRIQSGKLGELAAERFFADNGFHMVRTQPETTILGTLSVPMVMALKRFIPRLAHFGYMVIARMHKGGVADYCGYEDVYLKRWDDTLRQWVKDNSGESMPIYRACEVKEASGSSMPASRLDRAQRAFLASLPKGCAWVGIFFTDHQKFEMFPFVEKGSYKKTMEVNHSMKGEMPCLNKEKKC